MAYITLPALRAAVRCAAEALACGESEHTDAVILEWVAREADTVIPFDGEAAVLRTFRRAVHIGAGPCTDAWCGWDVCHDFR